MIRRWCKSLFPQRRLQSFFLFFFFLRSAVVLACLPTFLKRTNRKIKQCLFTAGYLGRLDRCHATRPSRTECFRRVSRLEDNGKTDKSSWTRIVTFLLKLSSQWVKYALACVYINLPIGEMKKKKANMSEFIHNLARGRMATACFLPSVVHHGTGKLPKRKVRPSSNVDVMFHVPNLRATLHRDQVRLKKCGMRSEKLIPWYFVQR